MLEFYLWHLPVSILQLFIRNAADCDVHHLRTEVLPMCRVYTGDNWRARQDLNL